MSRDRCLGRNLVDFVCGLLVHGYTRAGVGRCAAGGIKIGVVEW